MKLRALSSLSVSRWIGSVAALVAGLLLIVRGPNAWAHQDPAGCSGTGVALDLLVFYADGVSPADLSVPVSECEMLIFKAVVGEGGANTCAFEGGTITITTPDGVAHDVTPGGGVPQIGGSGINSITSDAVTYTVDPGDDDVGDPNNDGFLTAKVSYQAAFSHTGATHTPNVPASSTAAPIPFELCPTDTDCVDNFCDPNLTDSPGIRKGRCTLDNLDASTPCPDTDQNVCTTAGCNGLGTCNQSHIIVPLCGQCGDGTVNPPETCDPPGSTQSNGLTCRGDCTYCGDGIFQPGSSVSGALVEVCDDGNDINDDSCSNLCQRIQNDPARINFKKRPFLDEFKMHGRLQPVPDYDPLTGTITVRLENANGVIFEQTVPAGIVQRGKSYIYRNMKARKSPTAAMALFKVIKRGNLLSAVTVKLYDDLTDATLARMKLTITVGSVTWTIEADWKQLRKGWNLSDQRIFG